MTINDLESLLEDIFNDPFTVTQRSAGEWLYSIASGDHAGYQVDVLGTGLDGTGDSPTAGTIGSISVTDSGANQVAFLDGLSLGFADFAQTFDGEGGGDGHDGGGDGGGDGGFEFSDLGDLFEHAFNVDLHGDTEWHYVITQGDFAGWSITVDGSGLTGDGDIPGAGTIDSITVRNGDTVVGQLSGLGLSVADFSHVFENDVSEHWHGGSESDERHGGAGSDDFDGGDGNDHLFGGDGDDDLNGGTGDDDLNGGSGDDALDGQGGSDTVSGGVGADTLAGGTGGDHVAGGSGDDDLDGGGGNDDVNGGGDDDDVSGGGGSDTVNGGAGTDTLTGGAGADIFVFNRSGDIHKDTITDFGNGHDRIDLSGIDANGGRKGDGSFHFLASEGAHFTHHAGELRWVETGRPGHVKDVVQGDINGDGSADFQITLDGSHHLRGGDFIL